MKPAGAFNTKEFPAQKVVEPEKVIVGWDGTGDTVSTVAALEALVQFPLINLTE